MAGYETGFDLTNCGYSYEYTKHKFMLAKLLRKSFIFIYTIKTITMSQQFIHFTWV